MSRQTTETKGCAWCSAGYPLDATGTEHPLTSPPTGLSSVKCCAPKPQSAAPPAEPTGGTPSHYCATCWEFYAVETTAVTDRCPKCGNRLTEFRLAEPTGGTGEERPITDADLYWFDKQIDVKHPKVTAMVARRLLDAYKRLRTPHPAPDEAARLRQDAELLDAIERRVGGSHFHDLLIVWDHEDGFWIEEVPRGEIHSREVLNWEHAPTLRDAFRAALTPHPAPAAPSPEERDA